MRILSYFLFFIILVDFGGLHPVDQAPAVLTKEDQQKLNKALSIAIKANDSREAEKLVKQGADVGQIGHALQVDFRQDEDVQKVALLFWLGVDPNDEREDFRGNDPYLDYVIAYYDLLRTRGPFTSSGPFTAKPLSAKSTILFNKRLSRMADIFRLAVLYGGRANKRANTQRFLELLAHVFPQRLLQAIALGYTGQVKEILSITPLRITDNQGVSALAYAAGHGNEQIIGYLLQHPVYQYDTQGLEQALDIVASRLRGLKPESPDYERYNAIFDGLKKELGISLNVALETVAKTTEQIPGSPNFPDELKHYIAQLMLDPYSAGSRALFPFQGKL
jgi:hypothetical protein